MEKLSDKTWDETQAKILTIDFIGEGEKLFRASNVIFEGVWIIFYDIEVQRIRSFPAHRINGVMSQ